MKIHTVCILLNFIFRIQHLMTTCHILVILETVQGSTVLISDQSMSKMIELTTKQPYCNVHTDRGNIRNMLLAADSARVRQMSDDAIRKLEEICQNKKQLLENQGGFTYPGTKWCGPGDKANNYSDLGYHAKEDMCCREHDNCPKYLMKGECREGICNNSPFTRSHCDCDAAFRKCLQNVNSETANTIGAIFFNIIQVICFKERSPCSEWQNDSNDISRKADEKIKSFFNIADSDCHLEFVRSGRYIPSKTNNSPRWNFGKFKRKKLRLIKSFILRFKPFEMVIPEQNPTEYAPCGTSDLPKSIFH